MKVRGAGNCRLATTRFYSKSGAAPPLWHLQRASVRYCWAAGSLHDPRMPSVDLASFQRETKGAHENWWRDRTCNVLP
jgi:hypothetical protein